MRDEPYPEGIFVGYRYFDTFEKPVRYGFGYGLSYTEFALSTKNVEASDEGIDVVVEVTNTGRVSGRDVVQIYASVPMNPQEEYRRLAGYQKTKLLQPRRDREITIQLPKERFERYDEASGLRGLSMPVTFCFLRETVWKAARSRPESACPAPLFWNS